MKKQLITATVLAAALVVTTSTVSAISNIGVSNVLSPVEASAMEQYVKTPLVSVTDGSFTLTLEQVMAFPTKTVFVYSVEGITKEAQTKLQDESFDANISIQTPKGSELRYSRIQYDEIQDLRTATKKYYSGSAIGMHNPKRESFSFSLDIMGDEAKAIEVSTQTNVETLQASLSAKNMKIQISPLDISVEMDGLAKTDDYSMDMELFFRMQDDSLKTFNELFDWPNAIFAGSEKEFRSGATLRYLHSADVRGLLDISKLKSIVVTGLEYDLRNPSEGKAVQIPDNFLPFTVQAVLKDNQFMLPVKEVIEKLGGKITIDEAGKHAVIEFRESTFEIWAGKDYYHKDGVQFTYQATGAVAVGDNGTLLMNQWDFDQCFKVAVHLNLTQPVENSMCHIIP